MQAHVYFRRWILGTAVLACTLGSVGCSSDRAPIEITDARAAATPPAATVGAVYLTLKSNTGDVLLGAETGLAREVQIHTMHYENGMTMMQRLERLPLERGSPIELEPGGTHFMLLDLSAPLQANTSLPLKLRFERAGDIAINVPVVEPSAIAR